MKTKSPEKKFIILMLFLCIFAGVAIGAALGLRMDTDSLFRLEKQLNLQFQNTWQTSTFIENIIKNSGIMLLIWLLAFLPFGNWGAVVVLIIKAMGYGYTSAVLALTYGGAGFLYTLTHLGPQALILLSAAAVCCYVNFKNGSVFRGKNSTVGGKNLTEYFLFLLLAEVCVLLASFL